MFSEVHLKACYLVQSSSIIIFYLTVKLFYKATSPGKSIFKGCIVPYFLIHQFKHFWDAQKYETVIFSTLFKLIGKKKNHNARNVCLSEWGYIQMIWVLMQENLSLGVSEQPMFFAYWKVPFQNLVQQNFQFSSLSL